MGMHGRSTKLQVLMVILLSALCLAEVFAQEAPVGVQEVAKMRACPVGKLSSSALDSVEAVVAQSRTSWAVPQGAFDVPVYVHILQSSSGSNPVTDAQIAKTIKRLNRGFRKAGFVFEVKSTQTIVNDSWATIPSSDADVVAEIVQSKNVGARNGLNIYIADTTDLCGFADLPYSQNEFESLFMHYNCMVDGEYVGNYDTIIHESGHFMGLLHTFAPEPNGCKGRGDRIDDTPYEREYHFDCKRFDTCPAKKGLDPVHNHMDYTGDDCRHVFTSGQVALMRSAHYVYRVR